MEVDGVIARDDPKSKGYRPFSANKKVLYLLLTPEQHAALQAWAKAHGYKLANVGLEALKEWMKSRGIDGGGEEVGQVERVTRERA